MLYNVSTNPADQEYIGALKKRARTFIDWEKSVNIDE